MARAIRGIVLTADLAHAAGWDAGNRSMRKAGRAKWNEDDWNAAARTTNRLMRHLFIEAGYPVPKTLQENAA